MLSNIALFSDLADEDLEIISSHSVIKTYPKNCILINEGDHSDALYVILSGKVKIFLSDENGKEIILNMQEAGEYFGELALLDDEPRSASVMTLEPTRLMVISKADLQHCLSQNPELTLKLIRYLSQRVRSLTETVRNLALRDVYGRVAQTLEGMAVEQEGKRVIEQRLTHQDIANMVGASREMVSRIMKDLSTGGYIRVINKRISIETKLPPGW